MKNANSILPVSLQNRLINYMRNTPYYKFQSTPKKVLFKSINNSIEIKDIAEYIIVPVCCSFKLS